MRWDHLFADLDGQLSAAQRAQFKSDVADLTRAERASVELAGRLVATRGSTVTLQLRDGQSVSGVVVDASGQWILVGDSGPQSLVPLAAISWAQGLAVHAAPMGEVERRLSLGHALRALARDRANVVVSTDSGQVAGVIGAVAADHLDLVKAVGGAVAVPFGAIVRIRST